MYVVAQHSLASKLNIISNSSVCVLTVVFVKPFQCPYAISGCVLTFSLPPDGGVEENEMDE